MSARAGAQGTEAIPPTITLRCTPRAGVPELERCWGPSCFYTLSRPRTCPDCPFTFGPVGTWPPESSVAGLTVTSRTGSRPGFVSLQRGARTEIDRAEIAFFTAAVLAVCDDPVDGIADALAGAVRDAIAARGTTTFVPFAPGVARDRARRSDESNVCDYPSLERHGAWLLASSERCRFAPITPGAAVPAPPRATRVPFAWVAVAAGGAALAALLAVVAVVVVRGRARRRTEALAPR